MFGGQLGALCSPVVLIGLSVRSQIMMNAIFLAAGDDGDDGDDDDDGTDAAKAQTLTHKRHSHKHIRIDFSTQNSIDNYADEPVVMCMA